MNNFFAIIPTKIKLILFALSGLIIITTIILALQTPGENAPQNIPVPSIQKTQPGQKVNQDLEKRLKITSKEASSEGKIIYTLESQNPIRTDQIITQNNQVIFERTYIPENPNDPNHLLISAMTLKYGPPEKVIQGSKIWGPFIKTYIYSNKGFAFIGNPNTDEVYELQTFSPTSASGYIQKYGDDIDETPPHGES